jgi:hypothetical protein
MNTTTLADAHPAVAAAIIAILFALATIAL